MMKPLFYVYRVQIPSYLDEDFTSLESVMVKDLGGELVKEPVGKERLQIPQIMLSSSQTKLQDLDSSLFDLIIHPNSGYDNFNTQCLSQWSIPIVLGNQLRAQSVAEYIMVSLMHFSADLPWRASWDDQRLWKHQLLGENKILIFGSGEIGLKIEGVLKALGLDCIVVDPYKGRVPSFLSDEIGVIILCCSLNQENKGMVNKNWLKQFTGLKCLINSARGGLINQDFIERDILDFDKVTFYLDVFPHEPYDFNKLSSLSNVFLSSHVAGVSKNLERRMIEFEKGIIKDFLELDLLNFRKRYSTSLLESKFFNGMMI